MSPDANDPFFDGSRNQLREALKARFAQLTTRAREIVPRATAASSAMNPSG